MQGSFWIFFFWEEHHYFLNTSDVATLYLFSCFVGIKGYFYQVGDSEGRFLMLLTSYRDTFSFKYDLNVCCECLCLVLKN